MITNEIKAKVFAQYLGQKIKWNVMGLDMEAELVVYNPYTNYSDGIELSGLSSKPDSKLILKPLSAISDEDAIEVAKILGFSSPFISHQDSGRITIGSDNGGLSIWHDGEILSDDSIGGNCAPVLLFAYQYLQSKGYDLPQHALGGKTLHEAGLAIYESPELTK